MLAIAARQWWVLVLQGVLGILVGFLAIISWAILSGAAAVFLGWRLRQFGGGRAPAAGMA